MTATLNVTAYLTLMILPTLNELTNIYFIFLYLGKKRTHNWTFQAEQFELE